MTRFQGMTAGAVVLLAIAAPRAAAADCVPAELAPFVESGTEICPEEAVCPCFSEASIDAALAVLDPYLYAWGRRPWNVSDQTSLRGDTWVCDANGWSAPTVGFDTYIETDACGTPERYVCAAWADTWQAAPLHSWAGDGYSVSQEITADEFDTCEALLLDWADDAGAPSWSW